ncbi:hypothetical protein [Candidatus Viridilinea mediisalina]|uniref:Uncharacterized protein n=1 Tax=Candidatus Viridilinea mediisalina TaxID=2024553 RepID=A0A2A6REM4_9CHLR|nr:hypothetical protein [Candidatus Viridilinea mediisalina]PDW01032.1 hypothetical protein CJ255_19720 [Candidatus Viridilinea mediisalina]
MKKLVSVATPAATHLRRLSGVRVVLDSGAWPPNNPRRPPFDAWWQELGRWRNAPDDDDHLAYAIAMVQRTCQLQSHPDRPQITQMRKQ